MVYDSQKTKPSYILHSYTIIHIGVQNTMDTNYMQYKHEIMKAINGYKNHTNISDIDCILQQKIRYDTITFVIHYF